MSVSIEPIDPSKASEPLLRSLHDLYVSVDDEDIPGDPPLSFEKRLADWRQNFARFPARRWVARDGDNVVGAALTHYDVEENLENGMGRVMVHPDQRGRGYCRMLAEPVLDHLEDQGRTRLETWITANHPAEALAKELGLKSVLEERRSRLLISDVDRSLMRSWIDRASERASDYELMEMISPFPEEHLEQFCQMLMIMNTAPLEDYEMDDEHLSPADWRDIEASVVEGGNLINNLTAVHKPTGDFAGYTQVKTQGLQPDLAWQWDTGVHPDHRNRGLGRWLKAAMIEHIVDQYPDVERIDTENAGSNEPMLNINFTMGFKPIHDVHVWQGELSSAKKRLGF